MRRVYVAVLTSPEFLFHPADAKKGRGLFSEKSSYTLASRLSYWLWNGPPDEELLATARDDSLSRPEVLHAQIDRLLAAVGSSKERILTANVYLSDINDFALMNKGWDAWVSATAKPARATVEARLASPEYLVEIQVTALA
jgi:hypothetical protein